MPPDMARKLYPRNTIWLPEHASVEGENLMGSHSSVEELRQLIFTERGRISLSGDGSHKQFTNTSAQSYKYVNNTRQTQQVVFIYLPVCVGGMCIKNNGN